MNSINPAAGPTAGGTVVTIGGQNLAGATAVHFGSAAATSLITISATQVQATSPAGAGTVDVTVSTAGGTSATGPGDQFTYTAPGTTTFTVNSTLDLPDATSGDGSCATSAGTCTLRAAVMEANTSSGSVMIVVPPGTYLLTIPPDTADGANTGDLNLTANATIAGSGPAVTIIDGNKLDRVIDVVKGATVAIIGVTVQNGKATGTGYPAGMGGGVRAFGSLSMSDSTISGNVADVGGGVAGTSAGLALNLDSVTISANIARVGGGVEEYGGTVNIANSLVTQNRSYNYCAGVDEDGGGVVNILNSTISYNSASPVAGFPSSTTPDIGGACEDGGGRLSIIGSTISHNHSDVDAGGIVEDGGGILYVRDTAVLNNDAGDTAGGIYLDGGGGVVLDHVTVSGNRATGAWSQTSSFAGSGGGITEDGGDSVTLIDSTISGNSGIDGAGIYMDGGGTWTISGSTISGNVATGRGTGLARDGYGGGVLIDGGNSVAITNSTIANNSASGHGGGLVVFGTSGGLVRLSQSTVSGNQAAAGAGNLEDQATTAGRGIVANGDIVVAGATNCVGMITAAGHNLDDGTSCKFDISSTNPQLQPLSSNGGPTQTEALAASSPAIDAGGPCSAPATDQRGVARPFGAGCDLGAFEFNNGGTAAAPPDPSYASQVVADGAAYYYRLDELSTTNFGPYSSAYYHRLGWGAANASPGQSGPLRMDPDFGVKGNGTGPIATSGSFSSFYGTLTGAAARSVELWYRAATPQAADNLLCYGSGQGGAADFCLDVISGVVQFDGQGFANGRIDDGAWHHLAVTYDGGTVMTLTVDAAQTYRLTTLQLATGTTIGLQFGQHFGGTHNLTGYLSEVALYPLVLTPAQIQDHYARR